MKECLLCGTKAETYDYGLPNTFLFNCSRCGSYVLSTNNLDASEISTAKNGKEIVSYWVKKNQVTGKEILLDMQLINNILKDSDPSKTKGTSKQFNFLAW